VNFELDSDLEHNLDGDAPGHHYVKGW